MVQSNPANQGKESDSSALPAVSDMKFEAALAELEQIVRHMEDGQLPLEESIDAYRRGSELLDRCQRLLGDAEQRIQILENGVLRDFETNGRASQ